MTLIGRTRQKFEHLLEHRQTVRELVLQLPLPLQLEPVRLL
jgi:hypothetical protein